MPRTPQCNPKIPAGSALLSCMFIGEAELSARGIFLRRRDRCAGMLGMSRRQ